MNRCRPTEKMNDAFDRGSLYVTREGEEGEGGVYCLETLVVAEARSGWWWRGSCLAHLEVMGRVSWLSLFSTPCALSATAAWTG